MYAHRVLLVLPENMRQSCWMADLSVVQLGCSGQVCVQTKTLKVLSHRDDHSWMSHTCDWPHLHLTKLHSSIVADDKCSSQTGYRVSCLDCGKSRDSTFGVPTGDNNISKRHSFKPSCYQADILWNILNGRQTMKSWTHPARHVHETVIVHNSTNSHLRAFAFFPMSRCDILFSSHGAFRQVCISIWKFLRLCNFVIEGSDLESWCVFFCERSVQWVSNILL